MLSENSNLRISYYQQRVHKMVAAGVAVALIIVIIGMMAYRHQRMRDSKYIYKYVKLAASRRNTVSCRGRKRGRPSISFLSVLNMMAEGGDRRLPLVGPHRCSRSGG